MDAARLGMGDRVVHGVVSPVLEIILDLPLGRSTSWLATVRHGDFIITSRLLLHHDPSFSMNLSQRTVFAPHSQCDHFGLRPAVATLTLICSIAVGGGRRGGGAGGGTGCIGGPSVVPPLTIVADPPPDWLPALA